MGRDGQYFGIEPEARQGKVAGAGRALNRARHDIITLPSLACESTLTINYSIKIPLP